MNRTFAHGLLLLALSAAAVPSSVAYSFSGPPSASTIHSGSNSGYLGVDLRDLSDDQAAALHQRDSRGAEIVLVDHDAPAGKAGLRVHDIVLRINGQPVGSQDQARHILHDCAPATNVVLFISRDGQLLTILARMSTREEVEHDAWVRHIAANPVAQEGSPEPANTPPPPPATTPAPSPGGFRGNTFISGILPNATYTGVMLEQISGQLAQFFGSPSGTGLLIRSVADNSPGAAAGLHAGDVVIRANGRTIVSPGDWTKAVKASHSHPLSVVVLRDKHEETLTLTPDPKRRSSLEELIQAPERTIMAHLNLNWFPHS